MLPITVSWSELGIDAPEPDFEREKGQDWFLRQPEAVQRQMMGNAKFDAWQQGLFELTDLPHRIESDVWGAHWTPKSLRGLIGNDQF